MRRSVAPAAAVIVLALAGGGTRAQAPAAEPAGGQTRTTWYFYKVRWGFQDEFLDLFQKNHYPVLKARKDAGAFTSIRTFTPRYHGDGRADWTFAVELVAREDFKGPSEAEVIRTLYPDQETFRKEERRRFELLEAHWDVPLEPVDFESRGR
ncbi:MAG TPA: hypothetical protein VNK41_01810 [Vicinamibacterales bacterium]|nr:hypothetical protein [Vicinamibacterales bacterium]